MRYVLAVTVLAVLLLAALSTVARADELAHGWILDQGAPMYSVDPNGPLCALGCTQPDTTPVAGTPVDIYCRSEFGYLKVQFATQPGVSWVFAADVHAFGTPPACGPFD